MLTFTKKNRFILLIFIITLILGIITFLTFIDRSFIKLNEKNLQNLLIIDLVLVLSFFVIIFFEILNVVKDKKNKNVSSQANIRYVTFFSLSTLLPSILIAIFSLFLFSFALEKYLDKKVTTAVNNSYDIAKNYVQEIRKNIETDILLIAFDLNKNINIYYANPKLFKNIIKNQRLLRKVDEIHLVDGSGKQIISDTQNNKSNFIAPNDVALEMVSTDQRALKILDTYENKSAALIKLTNYIDTYLYVIKFLDPNISTYLQESEQAINFYYTVENKRLGIKISFVLIYIIIVTLLLFLSITLAIKFSARFFKPIANLIGASESISSGNLDTKVPLIDADDEIKKLNKNFNLMIDRLRSQQDKLLYSERHEAWENVARKLAHEIKNPLTPIQLSIDRLKDKYSGEIKTNKNEFQNYLVTINKQIKAIERLVNEFSDFARMPKPILRNVDLKKILESNIELIKASYESMNIKLIAKKNSYFISCDEDQINRVFLNLIKNSVESIQEKSKGVDFIEKIGLEIKDKDNYTYITIIDNGIGFSKKNLNNIVKPYFTTKINGSGLGLAIVNKIINDHDGKINFLSIKSGARIEIVLPNNVN